MEVLKTTRFEDVYFVKSTISRGVMGNVYKVIHKHNQTVYAAKKVHKNRLPHFDRKCLQGAAEILTKLEHPNIVSIFQIYDNPEHLFFVMEYFNGLDLFEWLIKLQTRTEVRVSGILKTILDAVEFSHSRGVFHGHLCPSSILVIDHEGNPTIKIASFHKSIFPPVLSKSIYCSPETLLSPSVDFWSIGILLYVMLTGRDPFECKPKNSQQNKVPEEQLFPWQQWSSKDLIKHLLQTNPVQCFSAEDIKNHPWLQSVGNLTSQLPQLKYNLFRQSFDLRTTRALGVAASYLWEQQKYANMIIYSHVDQKSPFLALGGGGPQGWTILSSMSCLSLKMDSLSMVPRQARREKWPRWLESASRWMFVAYSHLVVSGVPVPVYLRFWCSTCD